MFVYFSSSYIFDLDELVICDTEVGFVGPKLITYDGYKMEVLVVTFIIC